MILKFKLLLFVSFIYIVYIFIIINIKKNNFKIIIFLFSCNREIFLNDTLNSLLYHFDKYENKVSYTLYFSDSGTANREYYVHMYKIANTFYMNPSNFCYVYNIAFSLLYMKYVLFMEDDRPFIKGIEHKIEYSSYIEEGLQIMETSNYVYGITFKPDIPTEIKIVNIKTNLGYHKLCIVIKPLGDYYYVNGPTLYSTRYLKLLDNYVSEYITAIFFKTHNLNYGYTYKHLNCNYKNTFSIKCQSVSLHLDFNRKLSTNKRKRCNIYLY